ncbi:MAG: tetratricopeptide repeat protein [Magnetococcales bacterium]|nr:tetratricopeptide repeat protein [Magnetococcales bacterium]MBF0116320.1 tetratricopeptide repeat protein [Magnetococcales bacterium]
MRAERGRALAWRVMCVVLGMHLFGCVTVQEHAVPVVPSLPDAGVGKNAAVRVQKGLQEADAGNWEPAMGYFSDALSYADLTGLERAVVLNNRGVMQQRLGWYEGAVADFSAAIKMRAGLSGVNLPGRALFNRGVAHYFLGEYAAAMNDLEQFSLQYPSERQTPYTVLWLYLARERSGSYGRYGLSSSCRSLWSQEACAHKSGEFAHLSWPGPLFALHLEQLSAEEMLARVPRGKTERQGKEYLCDAYFHLGEYYQLRGASSQAREWWQKAIETGMTHLSEYTGSQLGMQRGVALSLF